MWAVRVVSVRGRDLGYRDSERADKILVNQFHICITTSSNCSYMYPQQPRNLGVALQCELMIFEVKIDSIRIMYF